MPMVFNAITNLPYGPVGVALVVGVAETEIGEVVVSGLAVVAVAAVDVEVIDAVIGVVATNVLAQPPRDNTAANASIGNKTTSRGSLNPTSRFFISSSLVFPLRNL